jgi:hypothetical protein
MTLQLKIFPQLWHFNFKLIKMAEKPCIITNDRYTKDIAKSDLDKYNDTEYDQYEKKMDIHLLHAVSEQRCRPWGCRLEGCLMKFRDLDKCSQLFRELNKCVEVERKKVIYEYITTGVQTKY